MEQKEKTEITIQAIIRVPVEQVWKYWNDPADIVRWNQASDDWHTVRAENDLQPGGKFSSRMEAKDGSMGFDFWGIYDRVVPYKSIEYTMGDGRKVKIVFSSDKTQTGVVETFEAESENTIELQRNGWQAILNNLKKYAEANYTLPLV
jgi:uncharacterized protein YndB with AHSA1/START domain